MKENCTLGISQENQDEAQKLFLREIYLKALLVTMERWKSLRGFFDKQKK
ncbi:hypothetical protein YC2023_105495 [Brassica napus]